MQRKTVLPRQYVDGSAAVQHIEHHLLRDLKRKRRHAFSGNAMVARKNHDLRVLEAHHVASLYQPQLQRQVFKLAQ